MKQSFYHFRGFVGITMNLIHNLYYAMNVENSSYTSTILWFIRRPFLAAEDPTTIALISPSLY